MGHHLNTNQRRLRVKRTTLKPVWAMTALIAISILSACVRPAPDMVDPAANATATPDLFIGATIAPLPTIDTGGSYPAPGTAASPTPLTDLPTAAPAVNPTAEAQPSGGDQGQQPPAAQVTSPSGETIHIVQAGENLFRIGLRYGFTAQELATYNGIPNVNVIYVGQEIRIPPK
jgi:LysM repeat protein